MTDQPDKQKNDQEQEGLIEAQIDEILKRDRGLGLGTPRMTRSDEMPRSTRISQWRPRMTRSHGAQIDKSEPMEVQNEEAEPRSQWIPGKRWMIPKSSGRGDPEGRAEDDATESGNGKSKERKAERKAKRKAAAKPKEKPDKHKNNIFSEQKGKEKK